MTDLTPDSNGRIGLEGIVQVLADGHEIGQRANFFPTEGRVLEDSEDGTIYLGDGTQWLTVGAESGLTTPSLDVSGSIALNGLDVAGSASADSLDVSGSASIDGNVEPFTAGHDDVRVPQVRNLTVEDWESGTLDTDVYNVASGEFSVQSSIVSEGSYALQATSQSDGGRGTLGARSGLDSYPQAGDTFSYDVYLTGPEQAAVVHFFSAVPKHSGQPAVTVRADTNDFAVVGNNTDVDISSHINEWLTVTVKVGLDGSVEATLTDSSDTVLATGTGQTSQRSGTVVRCLFTQNIATESGYFDNFTVTRREPEARANTQKGVTELGNEVVPSGSIQTGPLEVPTDHPTYPLVNLPVTDDLSAGEQVGYHLAINQDKALTLEAEADGNGGIQNANVSFENTQIADPAHNTSADSMTADPESASEDGFVEVDIDGTTYQVPMYQA